MKRKIGILALQGSFKEHAEVITNLQAELQVEPILVKLPHQLDSIDALIIPGGESTTIRKLLEAYNFIEKIKILARDGLPIYGTCAGMILLSRRIQPEDTEKSNTLSPQPMGLIDITVKRNAFGRQLESFEEYLEIPILGDPPFKGIFIRAPLITEVGHTVKIIARLKDKTIVAAENGNILVSAFHPELTDDIRFHRYFIRKINYPHA